jgi:histone deacetylase complex regulatory component SIN3
MAKETIVKENPVTEALKKLKEEEIELVAKLKPLQEAISALEKILDKSVKKAKPAKDSAGENLFTEENAPEETPEALN